MNKRLKEVREALATTKGKKVSRQALADELGVSMNNIESYELGRRSPSAAFIKLFCEKYNVNENWLKTGMGEMFNPISEETEIAIIVNEMLKNEPDDIRLRLTKVLYSLNGPQLELLQEIEDKIKNGL